MNHEGRRPVRSDLPGRPQPSKFDLNEAVQKLLRFRQDDHKIAVILDLGTELPETTADGEQIECVLFTLFSRSQKAIIDGKKPHGTIIVRTGLKAGRVQFSITDDGRTFFEPEECFNLTTCAEIVRDQAGQLYAWRPRHRTITTIVMHLPS
jgi:nitrogen fixation/metabolism regulation signal transduction histidine kinase